MLLRARAHLLFVLIHLLPTHLNLNTGFNNFFGGEDLISDGKKKSKTFAIMLVLALAVLFTFQMNPVWANTPDVTNVEYYSIGNNTFVRITVYHVRTGFEGDIDPNHYVEQALFDIDGTVEDVALEAQSTEVFTVEYNMGEVTGAPTVRARVDCTSHGLSAWSDTVVVPEFSTLSLLLILAMVSIAVLLFRFNARMRRES